MKCHKFVKNFSLQLNAALKNKISNILQDNYSSVPVKMSMRICDSVLKVVWYIEATSATSVTSGLPILRTGQFALQLLLLLLFPNAFLKAVTRFFSSGTSDLGSSICCSVLSASGKQAVNCRTSGSVHKNVSCCFTSGVVSWTSNNWVDFSWLENQPKIGCQCVKLDCFEATYRWQCSSSQHTRN